MSNDRQRLESSVLGMIGDRIPDESEVRDFVEAIGVAMKFSPDDREAVRKSIAANLLVKMDTGVALVAADHKPWLASRQATIDPYYWNRYEQLLVRQRFPRTVISSISKSTDEILDLCGNPEEKIWARRGLVMGDVQSGKTGTYAALMCKAADAGYGLVVLLTGTLESLRRQTQERLDASFVGFDSSGELKRKKEGKLVGVGLINRTRNATVFTSKKADFKSNTMNALGLTLASLKEPALVVVKKNTRILENLKEWLRDYNAGGDGYIDVPVMLIDDEADNASINTRDETDPTAINAGIRSILKLFRKSTYVGFTATPFANIFVHPEHETDMVGDDLFPRDFIYALRAPSNYFGCQVIFGDDAEEGTYLRPIEDAEPLFPLRHRRELPVDVLPESLRWAMAAFLVTNVIRDLREEGPTHRSMLINVSRFTAVQDKIELIVDDDLRTYKNDIRNFSSLPPAQALKSPRLAFLHEVWEREYGHLEFDWPQIQKGLRESVGPVVVTAVNQRTGARALDYKGHEESGLRVIAVGGNSLSRGLTLEGLCTSYFYRNSRMYDTLLQMGRWFGYRPGYQDLCRIWMAQEAVDWYAHIGNATEELRGKVRQMRAENKTPKEFGLRVRAHPDSLIVTARNKMRHAATVERIVSVSGESFESVDLPADRKPRDSNWNEVVGLMQRLQASGHLVTESRKKNPFLRGVASDEIARLIKSFRTPKGEILFQPQDLGDFIGSMKTGDLSKWDVVFPQGDAEKPVEVVPGLSVKAQKRRVVIDEDRIIVSGNKRRVGSRGIESEGLDESVEKAVIAAARADGKNPSDKDFRRTRTYPLLLIHVLSPYEKNAKDVKVPVLVGESPLIAVSLSFPEFDDTGIERRVRYRINLVDFRQTYELEVEDDLEDVMEGDSEF